VLLTVMSTVPFRLTRLVIVIGGPPAGFLPSVIGDWGVRRQPGSVIRKV